MLCAKEHRIHAGSISVSAPGTAELEHFDRHLEEVRGLAPSTRQARLCHLHSFLTHCFGSNPVLLEVLGAADVIRFINYYTVDWVPASIRTDPCHCV